MAKPLKADAADKAPAVAIASLRRAPTRAGISHRPRICEAGRM